MNTVAIVGRPNVGKSTLFNRLIRERRSIVDKKPGVTRDRVYGVIVRKKKPLILIDTGGFQFSDNSLETQIREQVNFALDEADIILLLVDGKEGISSLDREISDYIRKSEGEKALVINKMDKGKDWNILSEFGEIVLDETFQISAKTGTGMQDLEQWILSNCFEGEISSGTTIGVIGKPNTGKSTYINAVMGYERTITEEKPGTTRDSINSYLNYKERTITLVDTAGLKKKSRLKDSLEYYSFLRAIKAIEESDVVLVLLDAVKKVTRQDKRIIRWAEERKTPIVILLSKFDLVPQDKKKPVVNYFDEELSIFGWVPKIPVSSLTEKGIGESLSLALEVADKRERKYSNLEKVVRDAINYRPPPDRRKKIKLYSVEYHGGNIILKTNQKKNFNREYKKYLENRIRKKIDLKGIPISVKLERR